MTSGVSLAIAGATVLAVVAGCGAGRPDRTGPDGWAARTQAFLLSTLEPADPYPVVHLPQGRPSLYEQSAAVIVLSRSAAGGLPAADRDRFAAFAAGRWDPAAGWYADADAGSGPLVTWYTLRALHAAGRLDGVAAVQQRAVLASTRPGLAGRDRAADPFDRVVSFRLAAFLAEYGAAEVRVEAAAMTAGSYSAAECRSLAAGADIDAWAVAAEMARAAGAACPAPADAPARLAAELAALTGRTADAGVFSAHDIERLRSLWWLYGSGAATAPAALGARVAALRTALATDRVDQLPLAYAVTADLLAAAGLPVQLGEHARRRLAEVLRWGVSFTTFSPSAQVFLLVARAVAILPGDPDRAGMARLVDWSSVSGLDRLELGTDLDPGRIAPADFPAAIEQAMTPPAGAHGQPAGPARRSTVDRRAIAVVARAATVSGQPCAGALAAWAALAVERLRAEPGQGAGGSPQALALLARFLRFAATCPDLASQIEPWLRSVRASADRLLTDVRERAGAADVDELELWAALELACATGLELPADTAAVTAVLARRMAAEVGVGSADEPVSLDRTLAVARSHQVLTGGCGPG